MIQLKNDWNNVLFLYQFSWKISKPFFLLNIVALFWDGLTPFVMLIFPKLILDEISGLCRWNMVLKWALCMAFCMAVLKGVELAASCYMNVIYNSVDCKFGVYLQKQLGNADYVTIESGEKRNEAMVFYQNIHPISIVQDFSRNTVAALIHLTGYTYLLSMLNPLFGLLLLLLASFWYFLDRKKQKQQVAWSPENAAKQRRLQYLFSLLLDPRYAKETRINCLSQWVDRRFQTEINQYKKNLSSFHYKLAWIDLLKNGVSLIQMLLSYGWTGWQASLGKITIGSFTMYAGAAYALSKSLNTIVEKFGDLRRMADYVPAFKEYLRQIESTDIVTNPEACPKAPYTISFENVSFQYPNQPSYALCGINITIRNQEKLALVGLNGAGKTTFVKLLCRLYTPTSGRITVNGTDIQKISRKNYLELLSVVFQDFQLMALSLKENIVLNHTQEDKKLENALEMSGLLPRVNQLQQGLDTYVTKQFNEKGVDFSGGELQKIAIARAMYQDAPILILDEPAAALDPVAEYNLYQQLNEMSSGKTAIYISHRLSSTAFCDNVAVFSSGHMEEYGSHAALLKQNGLYAELYHKQAQYYVEEAVK